MNNKIEKLIEILKPKLDLIDGLIIEKKKENWVNFIFPANTSIVIVEATLSRIESLREKPEFESLAADKFTFLSGQFYIMLVD